MAISRTDNDIHTSSLLLLQTNTFVPLRLYKSSSDGNTYVKNVYFLSDMNWSLANGPTVGYTDGKGHGFQVA